MWRMCDIFEDDMFDVFVYVFFYIYFALFVGVFQIYDRISMWSKRQQTFCAIIYLEQMIWLPWT